jgi:hypothetical protein
VFLFLFFGFVFSRNFALRRENKSPHYKWSFWGKKLRKSRHFEILKWRSGRSPHFTYLTKLGRRNPASHDRCKLMIRGVAVEDRSLLQYARKLPFRKPLIILEISSRIISAKTYSVAVSFSHLPLSQLILMQ